MKIIYEGKTKKGKGFLIRYPEKDDALEMHKYINELSSEKTFIFLQGENITLDDEDKYLKEQLEGITKKQSIELIAEAGSKIIGVSSIHLGEGATNHEGTFGISLIKEYRNEGIGKILIGLTIKEAKKILPNFKIITLAVFENNNIAIKLYKNFGFIEYGKLPKGILYKGRYIDHIFMYKNV